VRCSKNINVAECVINQGWVIEFIINLRVFVHGEWYKLPDILNRQVIAQGHDLVTWKWERSGHFYQIPL
jgi:hypothetical protein